MWYLLLAPYGDGESFDWLLVTTVIYCCRVIIIATVSLESRYCILYIYHHVTVSLESCYCILYIYIYISSCDSIFGELLLHIIAIYCCSISTASPIEEKAWPFSPPHHLCGAVGIAIRFGRPGGIHWVDLFASTVLGDVTWLKTTFGPRSPNILNRVWQMNPPEVSFILHQTLANLLTETSRLRS